MDKIKNFFKNMQPWQWILVGVVTLFGIYSFWKKSQTTKTTAYSVSAPEQTSQSGSSSNLGDSSAMQEVSGIMTSITESLNNALSNQSAQIASINEKLVQQENQMNTNFNNVVNTMTSTDTNISNVLQEVSRSMEKQQTAAATIPNTTLQKVPEKTSAIITDMSSQVKTPSGSDIVKIQQDATSKIRGLQQKATELVNSGKMWTDPEVTAIHEEADKIGIAAGLQTGVTTDGSTRRYAN